MPGNLTTDRREKPASGELALLRTPRKANLSSVDHCRRELGKLYNDARAGLIETADVSRLAYVLKTIVDMFVASDFEKRMERLEKPKERVCSD